MPSKFIKEEEVKKKNRIQDNISKLLTETFLFLARDSSKGGNRFFKNLACIITTSNCQGQTTCNGMKFNIQLTK
jgi:hypothetical protein